MKSKLFGLFQSLWNVHKPNFTLIPWGNPKLLGQQKSKFIIRSKFIIGSNFLAAQFFSLYRYFIETTTTDIDMLSQCLLQFYNNCGFAWIFDIIMLFCPLLDDWVLCSISVVRQETWPYSTCLSKCSIHYAYSVSTLMFSGLTLV